MNWVIVTTRGHIYHADDATWLDDRLNPLSGATNDGAFAVGWTTRDRSGMAWDNFVPLTSVERIAIPKEES